jgi:hypothetical protein
VNFVIGRGYLWMYYVIECVADLQVFVLIELYNMDLNKLGGAKASFSLDLIHVLSDNLDITVLQPFLFCSSQVGITKTARVPENEDD